MHCKGLIKMQVPQPEKCPFCSGSGWIPIMGDISNPDKCDFCNKDGKKPNPYSTGKVCHTCGGLGWKPINWVRYTHWEQCPDCNTDRKIPYAEVDAVGELIADKCPKCLDVRTDCPDCGEVTMKTITVKISNRKYCEIKGAAILMGKDASELQKMGSGVIEIALHLFKAIFDGESEITID